MGDGWRAHDTVLKETAWVIVAIILLFMLSTGGGWFHSREVRELADDESTRAHRSDAFELAFILSMLACVAVYVETTFRVVSARDAVHIILGFGILIALLRFWSLEWLARQND